MGVDVIFGVLLNWNDSLRRSSRTLGLDYSPCIKIILFNLCWSRTHATLCLGDLHSPFHSYLLISSFFPMAGRLDSKVGQFSSRENSLQRLYPILSQQCCFYNRICKYCFILEIPSRRMLRYYNNKEWISIWTETEHIYFTHIKDGIGRKLCSCGHTREPGNFFNVLENFHKPTDGFYLIYRFCF